MVEDETDGWSLNNTTYLTTCWKALFFHWGRFTAAEFSAVNRVLWFTAVPLAQKNTGLCVLPETNFLFGWKGKNGVIASPSYRAFHYAWCTQLLSSSEKKKITEEARGRKMSLLAH